MVKRITGVALATLLCGSSLLLACASAAGHQDLVVRNRAGMQLMVAEENTQPTLRVVLPDRPTLDRSIEILFPEHVTVRKRGSTDGNRLYMWQPGRSGERPSWRRAGRSLEYARSLAGGVDLFIRTTGNVWSNPELTCQHVDPQAKAAPGEEATLDIRMLVVRGSFEDAFAIAMRQRESLAE